MQERGEMELSWTDTENQLADVLTKRGVNSFKLLRVLSTGQLWCEPKLNKNLISKIIIQYLVRANEEVRAEEELFVEEDASLCGCKE